jgi:hypothetical protein
VGHLQDGVPIVLQQSNEAVGIIRPKEPKR